jgi:hypothetical protein
MPDPVPPNAASLPPALDRDLYCLTCGYNLRGHSGDPVRCPECGNLNPMSEITLPAELISAQLRRMESAPATCVGTLLLFFTAQALFWWGLFYARRHPCPDAGVIPCCAGIASFGALVAWMWSVYSFRSSCLGKPGWLGVLVTYHLCGLVGGGAIIGAMALATWFLWPGLSSDWAIAAAEHAIVVSVLFGLCLAGTLVLVKKLYARLTQDMHILQREVATTLVRDRVRRKLHQSRRGWL